MRHFLFLALLCAAAAASVANASSCPDYQTAANPPTLAGPAKKSFRHFGNTLLSRLYKPWHMVHDQIIAHGQTISISRRSVLTPSARDWLATRLPVHRPWAARPRSRLRCP